MLRNVVLPVTMTSALSARFSTLSEVTVLPCVTLTRRRNTPKSSKPKRELARAGWDPFKEIVTVAVSGRRQLRLVDDEVDGHTREDCPGLIDDPSDDATLRLRVGSRRDRQDCDDSG